MGVAGIMGAGKSTVARVFEELGARRIDADALGKELLGDRDIREALIGAYGKGIVDARGRVDAAKLGRVAFKSPENARKLDHITREALVDRIKQAIVGLSATEHVIVVDAALLPEWDSGGWLDLLVVVDSGEEDSVQRVCSDSRFKPETVRARMEHQFSRHKKTGCADMIIPNYGSLEELKERARKVFETLVGMTGRG